jgi:hypothetical protein
MIITICLDGLFNDKTPREIKTAFLRSNVNSVENAHLQCVRPGHCYYRHVLV